MNIATTFEKNANVATNKVSKQKHILIFLPIFLE